MSDKLLRVHPSHEHVGTLGISSRGRTLDKAPCGNCGVIGAPPTISAITVITAHRTNLVGNLIADTTRTTATGPSTHGFATSTGSYVSESVLKKVVGMVVGPIGSPGHSGGLAVVSVTAGHIADPPGRDGGPTATTGGSTSVATPPTAATTGEKCCYE